MVWLNRFSSVGMKFVIILVISLCHTNAQDTTQSTVSTAPTTQSSVSTAATTQSSISTAATTQSSVSTAATTQPSVSTEATTQPSVSTEATTQPSVSTEATTQPSVSTAATTQPSVSTATTVQVTPDSQDTTESAGFATTNPIIDTSEFSADPSNTSITIPPTTTASNKNKCYPDKFPFGDGCISPEETAGVVITALVLSLISFVGALAGFSYMFYTRFLRGGGKGIRTNNDVPMRGMGQGNSRANGHSAAANPRLAMKTDDDAF